MLKITKPKPTMWWWEWAIVIVLDLTLCAILLRIAWPLCSG